MHKRSFVEQNFSTNEISLCPIRCITPKYRLIDRYLSCCTSKCNPKCRRQWLVDINPAAIFNMVHLKTVHYCTQSCVLFSFVTFSLSLPESVTRHRWHDCLLYSLSLCAFKTSLSVYLESFNLRDSQHSADLNTTWSILFRKRIKNLEGKRAREGGVCA